MADSSSEVIGEDLKSGLSKDQAAVPTALADDGSDRTQEDGGSEDQSGPTCSKGSAQDQDDPADRWEGESPPSQGEESTEAMTDDVSAAPGSEEEEEDPTEGESPEAESQSADSASFSVPSLEFSEGNNGNSPDEALSSSYSALGAEGQTPSVDLPCLGDEAALGAGAGAAAAAPPAVGGPSGAGPDPDPALPAYYFVKWIVWKDKKTPIITQSENGPCPLLAIMNILFLRWQVRSRVTAAGNERLDATRSSRKQQSA